MFCSLHLPTHGFLGELKRGANNNLVLLHFSGLVVPIAHLLFTMSPGPGSYSDGVSIMALALTTRIPTPPTFLHCWSVLEWEGRSPLSSS